MWNQPLHNPFSGSSPRLSDVSDKIDSVTLNRRPGTYLLRILESHAPILELMSRSGDHVGHSLLDLRAAFFSFEAIVRELVTVTV